MTAIFWSTLSLSAAGLVFRAVACGLALDIPRRGFDPVGGGDEEAWNTLGRAAQILDNLIAEGKAKPMIVVMPNGNTNQRAYSEAAPGMNDYAKGERALGKEVASMEESFPDIIKFVESNYRTLKGADNRAICGLSMGGGHTFRTTLMYPDTFGTLASSLQPQPSITQWTGSRILMSSAAMRSSTRI